MAHIILNHALVQAEKALVSVTDRGFRYGDAAFETIAVHGEVPYRFDWHMRRLARALDSIRMQPDVDFLEEECRLLLAANQLKDGLLRIQITRGAGGRGYLPSPATPTCVIETFSLPEIPSEPVVLYGSSYSKIPAIALPTEKLCQGLNSTLARMEANDYGCFDALMLDGRGHIAETSSGNIFWVKNDVLYTPALSCGAMSGSIRAAILALSPHPVQEVTAELSALASADAVFITNVAWKALAVKELKPTGLQWQSDKTACFFYNLIKNDMAKESGNERLRWSKNKAA